MKSIRFYLRNVTAIAVCAVMCFTYYGCDTSEDVAQILSFDFSTLDPPAAGHIDEEAKTVTVTVPVGTDVTKLEPLIVLASHGASVSPQSGEVQDFTGPVVYTVTAENGNTVAYTVTVKEPDAQILSFSFSELDPPVTGVIDKEARTISLEVSSDIDITRLVPSVEIPSNASINPVAGAAYDFTGSLIFTVVADDGSSASYTVTVTVKASSNSRIMEFRFPGIGASGMINEDTKVISVYVPGNTDVTNLVPTIVLASSKSSISPASGEGNDFTRHVTYTVTAEDGSTTVYTVRIFRPLSDDARIISFKIYSYEGEINESTGKITVTVPEGTNLLCFPVIEVAPKTKITPVLGTVMDFTDVVTYTVEAENGSTAVYTVTVVVKPEEQ